MCFLYPSHRRRAGTRADTGGLDVYLGLILLTLRKYYALFVRLRILCGDTSKTWAKHEGETPIDSTAMASENTTSSATYLRSLEVKITPSTPFHLKPRLQQPLPLFGRKGKPSLGILEKHPWLRQKIKFQNSACIISPTLYYFSIFFRFLTTWSCHKDKQSIPTRSIFSKRPQKYTYKRSVLQNQNIPLQLIQQPILIRIDQGQLRLWVGHRHGCSWAPRSSAQIADTSIHQRR